MERRHLDHDQGDVEDIEDEEGTEHSKSMVLEALALEPVASSSPPRKKLHTPRASSVSVTTTTGVLRKENREKTAMTTKSLFPVIENDQSQFSSEQEVSPSKSSPSRSPMSRLRGKDRPPLPQFDPALESSPEGADASELTRNRQVVNNKLVRAQLSPSPSPTPPSRIQSSPATMMGHGRRPPSRTGELSNVERMRRAVTGGAEAHRSFNYEESRHPRLPSITGSHSDTPLSRIGIEPSLGPRTARAFAAAGVLDVGPTSAPSNRVATWRSASVMGYRRDGVERDFGSASGARSLASSPIPMAGAPVAAGASTRRISALNERDGMHGADLRRNRAGSDAWNRSVFTRTPEASSRSLIIGGGPATDPSTTSSPTSTGNPRTTISSSTSSNLAPFELRSFRSSTTAVDANISAHQTAIQNLKERHELEKEALLSALSEAKKEARLERAAKEELTLELTEMGVYVEELEAKLGEALARIRWMEKEIGILKDAVGVSKVV